MNGEINRAGGRLHGGDQILADIVGGNDSDTGFSGGRLQQGLAHAAGFASNEELEHVGGVGGRLWIVDCGLWIEDSG